MYKKKTKKIRQNLKKCNIIDLALYSAIAESQNRTDYLQFHLVQLKLITFHYITKKEPKTQIKMIIFDTNYLK